MPRHLPPTPSLPLALAAATGVAAGSLLTGSGTGGLGSTLASPSPPTTDLAVDWGPALVPPDAGFRAAVDGLGLTVGGLGMATMLVALAAAATLLAAVGSLRRRELAVRSALGRRPRDLAALLLRRDGPVLLGAVAAGLVAGAAGAALLHGSWPVERSGGSFVPTAPALLAAGVAAALCLGVALGLTVLPVRYGIRHLSRSLAAGSRATADPREGGLRRVATVLQTAVSVALLSSAVLLWQALPGDGPSDGPHRGPAAIGDTSPAASSTASPEASSAASPAARSAASPVARSAVSPGAAPEGAQDPGEPEEGVPEAPGSAVPADDLVLLSATPGGAGELSLDERAALYEDLLDRMRSLATVASESIASPGAWTGVGPSDFVLADCGDCMRGMFWIPFVGEHARHYAVSPGFFESAGMELLAGRDFTLADGRGAEPVAVVTEPMARKNFEDGDPLGRRLRVGEGLESWYTVVGVVRERRPPALGLPDEPAHGVYLSALQHPPDRVEVGFRVSRPRDEMGLRVPGARDETDVASALDAVRSTAAESGLEVSGAARTSTALRRQQAAPLRWAAGTAALLGLVALGSALLGVHRVAAVEVQARRRELGIRLALGSTAAGLTRWVLGRAFRSSLLGALLAVPPTIAVTARLREAVGDVPLFDPLPFAGVAAVLLAAAVAGAWGPARRAGRLEPARVIAEE